MKFHCKCKDKILQIIEARCILEAVNKLFSNSPNLEAHIKGNDAIVFIDEIEYRITKEVL